MNFYEVTLRKHFPKYCKKKHQNEGDGCYPAIKLTELNRFSVYGSCFSRKTNDESGKRNSNQNY